jgi:uroporphyrinogen decarboxylase
MGLGLYFAEGEGPKFQKPIQNLADVQAITVPDPAKQLHYVLETIDLLKPQLSVPLLGFSGSPWTLATYMIEGGASKEFSKIKAMLYQQPETLNLLLEKLSLSVSAYLIAQIKAGCDAVMIFDTWGGILTTPAYQHYSLCYMEKIIKAIRQQYPTTPLILFTKNGSQWLELIAQTDCDCISVDWTISIGEARKRVGHRVALQGNLDPAVLYAKPDVIKSEVKKILDDFGNFPGHLFNLGHGMQPDFNPDHVTVLIDAVHEYSRR